MKDRKSQYHEMLRSYFKQQEDEKFTKDCTFQPKINSISQSRFYYYEVSGEDGSIKQKANVIKRNELWKEWKERKLIDLQKEQESKITNMCTFTPKMNRSTSQNRNSMYGSQNSPAKINHKAVDKFVHRQELARCLKKEKEILARWEKLNIGARLNNESLKSIDSQK